MDTLDRARADLAADRAWKARDRLEGLLSVRCDDEVLDLLGEVRYAMQDYPAAGAVWFACGRDDAAARHAIGTWHEKHGSSAARWQTLPRQVRETRRPALDELREVTKSHQRALCRTLRGKPSRPTAWERVRMGLALLFLLSFPVYWVIAQVTILHWIWGFSL